jgi:hypothetical protein
MLKMIRMGHPAMWRCPMTIRPEEIRAGDVSFLPIVAAYVKKLGIVDEVNRLCPI